MTAPCRMILDVDTGIDDALAIVYALRRPGIALEAVTTIFGNVDVATATRNTLQILELAGRGEVPVAPGAAHALVRPFARGAAHIHGVNGLGEVELPAPRARPRDEHAADLIIRMARAHPGAITLCPVGPLTNAALALARAPEIAGLLREIVLMGGTLFHPGIPGIASPMADANFWNDAEAARIVLRSGAKLTLVGMDVTMKALLTPAMTRTIAAHGPAAATLMRIADFYVHAYQAQYPGIAGCGLHDPLAVAVAEDPSLVTAEAMQVDVELAGELTRGQLVADRRRTGKVQPNAAVCLDLDVPRFTERFVAAMRVSPAR
ncbi:MAG: nucleoside hydrolase [Alphaproteobacteria bacterium]|nr:nucleoside hydrolase [Alphaproteobacteria bacterium]